MRMDHLPHIWCAGCGNGTLTRDVAVAVDELCNDPDERFRLDREKVVIVSGIGCSSRAAGYLDFNSIHTTHGRAIAFATGIKLANPELTVIVSPATATAPPSAATTSSTPPAGMWT
jgi:2-oxoglutarate ferredoxin oxidoreductase subunit beta